MSLIQTSEFVVAINSKKPTLESPPKGWELMALFFAYLAVVRDVPWVMRTFGAARLLTEPFKRRLLEIAPNGDLWYILAFSLLVLVWFVWALKRKEIEIIGFDSVNDNGNAKVQTRDLINAARLEFRRMRRWRLLKTLGWSWLREKLLDRMDVSQYGTFTRPPTWDNEPTKFDSIDRISFNDRTGIEYQYPRNFSILFVSEHTAGTIQFGPVSKRQPKFKDVALLFAASNFFIFWLLGNIVRRSLKWIWYKVFFLKSK